MKVTFLGTGTSAGVPVLGCDCAVCHSADPRDKRFRSAAMIESQTTRLLIDCGPDIRMSLLRVPFRKLDGVLLTHIHYDHVAGIDDLRAFCVFGDINIYAEDNVIAGLRHTMPYCFPPQGEKLYPGAPKLNLHPVFPHREFLIGDISVLPIRVMHDELPIVGYRFGSWSSTPCALTDRTIAISWWTTQLSWLVVLGRSVLILPMLPMRLASMTRRIAVCPRVSSLDLMAFLLTYRMGSIC